MIFRIFCALISLMVTLGVSRGAERRSAVVDVVQKTGPAVVNIRTEQILKRGGSQVFGFGDSVFDEFFQEFNRPRYYKTQSLGSGVLIDPRGYILTNAHVISQASKVYAALGGYRKEFEARLIGVDERLDLAVIKIDGREEFPFLRPGKSHDLMLGETVIVIGNPLGLGTSVTTGVVSSGQRRISMGDGILSHFIQTDALINPGNSGGPLLNINGELIGINTAIVQQAQGIGFSIPIDVAARVMKDLIDYGKIRRAYLGIVPAEINPALAGNRGGGGVLVAELDGGSPAQKGGIRMGDVILALDELPVETPEEFLQTLSSYTPDDLLRVSLLRGTQEMDRVVALSAMPKGYGLQYAERTFGFNVGQSRSGMILTRVQPGSPAATAGMRQGDLIAEYGGEKIQSVADFVELVERNLGRLPRGFLVVRGNRGYLVELP